VLVDGAQRGHEHSEASFIEFIDCHAGQHAFWKEERKAFFFEKKKQKTFVSHALLPLAGQVQEVKVF
jgi:hypothetical protein